jgi:hypothetical protein
VFEWPKRIVAGGEVFFEELDALVVVPVEDVHRSRGIPPIGDGVELGHFSAVERGEARAHSHHHIIDRIIIKNCQKAEQRFLWDIMGIGFIFPMTITLNQMAQNR